MPVDPGYLHADTPHERTVQKDGHRYGCHSEVTGDSRPRGRATTHIYQAGWKTVRIERTETRIPVLVEHTTHWNDKPCGTTYEPVMAPCEGCANDPRAKHQP